jgi:RimJ/RimL family protein N-acetyltransferase
MNKAMAMNLGEIVLHGREVVLRPLEREDAAGLTAAAGESRASYGLSPVPKGLEETTAYVERALRGKAAGQRYPFTIIWRDRVVGTTSYADFVAWEWPAGCNRPQRPYPDTVEIGYTWLAASAQRTSCNTEAKLLLFQHAFEVWQARSVYLKTDQRNQRSRSAIERLGCQFEGIRRAHMPGADGEVRDSAYYSMVAEEWPAARQRLIRMLGRGAEKHLPAG